MLIRTDGAVTILAPGGTFRISKAALILLTQGLAQGLALGEVVEVVGLDSLVHPLDGASALKSGGSCPYGTGFSGNVDARRERCTIILYKMEADMTVETTYSQARQNLAKLLDSVTQDREIVIIHRRRGEDAAVLAASELTSLLETAHLLRSPKNAERLLDALGRALKGGGLPLTVDELAREVSLDA